MATNRTYRIKVNEGDEYVGLNLDLHQDIDTFEILSLKVDAKNFYRLHTSNYGCIAGRVLANNAIGVPNVRISVFISADTETTADSVLDYLYPYASPMDRNNDGVRYNLLTGEEIRDCQQGVGTFPTKRLVLDDNNVFEIFDKYYKFTTTTNSSGDYMIFGVPVGEQTLHLDVDLSDIGPLLSQSPRDFIYKGYDANQFESPSKFKKSTNYDSLPQIESQNESIYVHPFWGNPSEMGESDSTGVRISRKDINLNYTFEPTCIFFGSIITDEKSNGFSEKCVPTERMGKMDRLTTGEGTIEMIRKTPDGSVESYNVRGAHLIDGDGVWCYQIPMNLDFVRTDETGNIVPTEDPNKGLPTRTRVRFRVSLNDFENDYQNNHLCKVLVPNNPHEFSDLENSYVFGTKTPDNEFRDLMWNKVYSVKSYVPRLQKGNWNREKRFSGFKAVNVNNGNNPVPYNNMRIDITFMFMLQCAIMHTLIWFAGVYNKVIQTIIRLIPPNSCTDWSQFTCLTVGDGACPDLDGWYFAPNCVDEVVDKKTNPLENTQRKISEREAGTDGTNDTHSIDSKNENDSETLCLTNKIDYFVQCMEMALAEEYEVIQFDFYNDWLNGSLYIPRWFAYIRKKRTFLFGLINIGDGKVRGCLENYFDQTRRFAQQCSLEYEVDSSNKKLKVITHSGCTETKNQKCHKGKGRDTELILNGKTKPGGGFVHDQKNKIDNKSVYYFRSCDFSVSNDVRVNYFLTDIILLGSINENDVDGIPQTFKYLTSSTYKMPTNIAATNMDTIGRLYGKSNGVLCGSDTVKPGAGAIYELKITLKDAYNEPEAIEQEPDYLVEYEDEVFLDTFKGKNWEGGEYNLLCLQIFNETKIGSLMDIKVRTSSEADRAEIIYETFDELRKSIKNTVDEWKGEDIVDFTKVVPSDKAEEGGTPDQTYEKYEKWAENSDFSGDTYNDMSETPLTEASGIDWGYTGPEQEKFEQKGLFVPGGHFLGLSCFNSESNIKSCVNLTRVCEAGTSFSRRKPIGWTTIYINGTKGKHEYAVVPTGLISGDEIIDEDFRTSFATLNYNGLRTEKNNEGIYKYKFIPCVPLNFDGALSNYTGTTSFNVLTETQSGRNTVYTRTYEKTDWDYVSFRLGIGNDDDIEIERKFLKADGNRLRMPMYENSFYFYFGIHDGSTALDKFYDKFYAECNQTIDEEVSEQ